MILMKKKMIGLFLTFAMFVGGLPTEAWADNGWWWPCPSVLYYSSTFGPRDLTVYGYHRGVDIPGATGAEVIATRSGIARTGYSNARGIYIVIDHEDGFYSVYQHLSRYNISDNVRVSQGQNNRKCYWSTLAF